MMWQRCRRATGGGREHAIRKILARALLLGAAALAAGCATLPPTDDVPPSTAIAASPSTPLGAVAVVGQPSADATGTRLLYGGAAALEARLTLIREARVSLDLQYYQFEPDSTGRLVARALVEAARRGVRVRLLLDDWYTAGADDMLAALDGTPGIEVRLYNPFAAPLRGALGRKLGLLWRFAALNARMHNKLFVADGAVAVVGGRNIGDAYFERAGPAFFVDFDLVAAGAVVADLAALFDDYWNSRAVWPARALLGRAALEGDGARRFLASLDAASAPPEPPPRDRFGRGALADELARGRLDLHWGLAIAFADTPLRRSRRDLVLGGSTDEASSIRELIWRRMARSRTEYLIVTPYLVPGSGGMQQAQRNLARGVAISILTNSLASTDVPWVHAAYRRYRGAMLDAGGTLRELSAGAPLDWGDAPAPPGRQATLHAKCVVFDRKTVFLGSLNFDPRSMSTNTEIGLFVDDETLAREILAVVDSLARRAAYTLAIDGDGVIEWRPPGGGAPLHDEPEAGLVRRVFVGVLAPLLPESLL